MNKNLKKGIVSLGVSTFILGITATSAFAGIARESRAYWNGKQVKVIAKTGRNATNNVSMIRAMAEMNIISGGTEVGPNAVVYNPSTYGWADGSFTTQYECQDGYTYHSHRIAGETGDYTIRVVTQ